MSDPGERRPIDPDDCNRMGWWPREIDADEAYEAWREEQDDE